MFRSLAIAAASLALVAGSAAPASATACRDTHGKFTKCSPAKAAPAKRCRDAKGHFAKCGVLGAK